MPLPVPPPGRVLTVNGGSSSLKFALYEPGDPPRRRLGGSIDRPAADDAAVLGRLEAEGALEGLAGVGHRVVHGGPRHFGPELVTPELLADLRQATTLDPAHLPAELALIEALAARLPGVPQVACFDTAFHRDLPAVAKLLPLPRKYADAGLRSSQTRLPPQKTTVRMTRRSALPALSPNGQASTR